MTISNITSLFLSVLFLFPLFIHGQGISATELQVAVNKYAEPDTLNRQKHLEVMLKHDADDYDRYSKILIANLVRFDTFYGHSTILRIAGQLEVGEKNLRRFIEKTEDAEKRLIANSALARMGNETELNTILNEAKSMSVDDKFINEMVPTLIYVRRRETFDLLFDIIINNGADCINENSGKKEICAYSVIRMMTSYIEDFYNINIKNSPVRAHIGTNRPLHHRWYGFAIRTFLKTIFEFITDVQVAQSKSALQ